MSGGVNHTPRVLVCTKAVISHRQKARAWLWQRCFRQSSPPPEPFATSRRRLCQHSTHWLSWNSLRRQARTAAVQKAEARLVQYSNKLALHNQERRERLWKNSMYRNKPNLIGRQEFYQERHRRVGLWPITANTHRGVNCVVWDRENLRQHTQLRSIMEACSDTELLQKTFKERTQTLKKWYTIIIDVGCCN